MTSVGHWAYKACMVTTSKQNCLFKSVSCSPGGPVLCFLPENLPGQHPFTRFWKKSYEFSWEPAAPPLSNHVTWENWIPLHAPRLAISGDYILLATVTDSGWACDTVIMKETQFLEVVGKRETLSVEGC